VFGISWIFFTLYKKFFGLRVSAETELAGLDIPEMGSVAYSPDAEPYRVPALGEAVPAGSSD
jgi:Amt family ammonium transporter